MPDNIVIAGMPYFPGVVQGKLQRNIETATDKHIIITSQDKLSSFVRVPAGIIVVEAAPFSHTMIGLLGLGVPTVLISKDQSSLLREGTQLSINGITGQITNNPEKSSVSHSYRVITPSQNHKGRFVPMADGDPVNLCASVRHASAAAQALQLGAKTIGLVRSEYLIPTSGSIPDQGFYKQAIGQICSAAAPLPVTFRLLDIASDKIPAWLPDAQTMNIAMGLQGVRLYNQASVQRVIEAQLGALSELSHSYDLRLLLPFLVRLEEYEYWSTRIQQQIPGIPIGFMAETLASVLDIAHLLQHSDLVAIGCNDLMQGLFAADRDQGELRHYLDPYAPLLYRLFRHIAEQSGKHLHKVQLCGVLSQLQGVLPVLLGLGFRTFSVDAPFIPYLAGLVSSSTRTECETLADAVCKASTTREVMEILKLPTDRHPPFVI